MNTHGLIYQTDYRFLVSCRKKVAYSAKNDFSLTWAAEAETDFVTRSELFQQWPGKELELKIPWSADIMEPRVNVGIPKLDGIVSQSSWFYPYLKTFLVIGYQGTRVLIHTHVELAMRCYDYCFIVFVWLRPEPAFVLVLFVLWRAKDIATFSTNDSGSTGWCSSRNRGGVPKRCKTAWHIETCRTECRTVPYSGRWVLSVLYRFPGCYEHADSGWSKQTAVSFLAWKFGTRRAWVWIWSLKTWGSCEQVQLCQRRSWSWEVSGTQLQALDAADWGAKYWLSGARYG